MVDYFVTFARDVARIGSIAACREALVYLHLVFRLLYVVVYVEYEDQLALREALLKELVRRERHAIPKCIQQDQTQVPEELTIRQVLNVQVYSVALHKKFLGELL